MKCCALLCAVIAMFGQDAGNVTGKWSGIFRDGPIFVILKQDGAQLTGSGGPTEKQQVLDIKGGSVDAGHVVFESGGLRFDLRLTGDTLHGELTAGGETSQFSLKRVRVDAAPVAFEVASVKHVPPPAPGQGYSSSMKLAPGRLMGINVSLKKLIMNSYEVRDYQLSGPDWLDSELFDIVATMPRETTSEEAIRMIQALLAERFHLTMHHEARELPVYALVIGKNGTKLKEVGYGNSSTNSSPGKIVANKALMSNLANLLSRQFERPVIDMTGLKGFYDFELQWTPDEGAAMPKPGEGGALTDSATGPSLMVALQQQLGLKLEMRKAPVDILVIDRVDRIPKEN